jgi:hypothetical protein
VTQAGVTQPQLLPVSTCDPSRLTQIEFVGPNTPNPKKVAVPNDSNNFGPAIGFSWQLPWLGEGKTTIRGGYQLTYAGAGRDAVSLDSLLGGAPGAINSAALNINDPTPLDPSITFANILATRALTLSDLPISFRFAPRLSQDRLCRFTAGTTRTSIVTIPISGRRTRRISRYK